MDDQNTNPAVDPMAEEPTVDPMAEEVVDDTAEMPEDEDEIVADDAEESAE